MNSKQKQRVAAIQKSVDKFEYGLGQADADIRFLLRVIAKMNPEIGEKVIK